MDAMMERYMKPGIVHFKAYPVEMGVGPIVETLTKICEDDFFAAVEVGWMKDPRVRSEARQVLDQSHIEVCYATQPAMFSQKLNLNAFDPEARRRAISQVKQCIVEADQLGAKWIRLTAGKDPGDAKREEAKKLLVDSLCQVSQFAQEYGNPGMTLKIFDRSIDKESLIGHFADARDVAREMRRDFPRFGLLADLSHFPLLGEDPREAIPLIRDYLVHVHIGNCYIADRRHPMYGDLQPRFDVPGSSVTADDVRSFFRLLVDLGFLNPQDRPVVSAEVRPLVAGERSELIVANAKRVIREAWALA